MIGDAAYESLWYNLSPNESRILLFLIMRSQKQLTITVGRFMNLSLQQFANVSIIIDRINVRYITFLHVTHYIYIYTHVAHIKYIILYLKSFFKRSINSRQKKIQDWNLIIILCTVYVKRIHILIYIAYILFFSMFLAFFTKFKLMKNCKVIEKNSGLNFASRIVENVGSEP